MKELLLLLCRYPFEEKNRDTFSRLIGEVQDWSAVVNLINAHGIIALAAYNIKEAGLEKMIPADQITILENGYLQSIVRNTWLAEQWKEVNEILCKAGMKHILLKGMALEHTLYGAKGLRQMNDNDLLLKPEDSFKAWYLLQQNGFTPAPLKSPLFGKIKFYLGRHLPALYKNGYVIEIHDKLHDRKETSGNSFNDPFIDAAEIFIGDIKAFILSREKQLMHLKKHFEDHALSGDCQLRLYTDIILLEKNCNIEFPPRFITDPMQGNKTEFRKVAYKTTLASIPAKHRLRFIIGDMFPSPEWMKKRYGRKGLKVFLYYPQRMGKLLWLI